MLHVEDYGEIVEILKAAALETECGHAFYVGSELDITSLLEKVTAMTDAKPDYVYFNNSADGYYSLSLDCEDGELYFSIYPAFDEKHKEFYSDYGLCLVDEEVPDQYEKDYKKYSRFGKNYESPVRICWGEEESEDNEFDEQCAKCEANCDAPCCSKNNEISEKTKVDTDDNGRVWGFTKSWKDDNSHFTYSYHSTNEKDVLDLIKKFKIDF